MRSASGLRCSGVSTRLTSSMACSMRLLAWSCWASICWRSASAAAASTVGCANSARACSRSGAAGLALRPQVGARGLDDLPDLRALLGGGADAVEQAFQLPRVRP